MTQETGMHAGLSGDERLIALLDRQLSLYDDLEAMGDRQAAAIESGDTDELLRVLSARQRLITRITDLIAETRPLLTPNQPEGVRTRLARLDDVIARIARADDRDRAALESRRDLVSSQLSVVTSGKRAVSAYAARQSAPTYQDRRG